MYQVDLHARFKKEFVLESMNFILRNNKLTFDSKFYLQIKSRAMSAIFVTTYANSSAGYYEVNVYSIIRQSYALPSKYFGNSWLRYLKHCQLLMKFNVIKPDDLL